MISQPQFDLAVACIRFAYPELEVVADWLYENAADELHTPQTYVVATMTYRFCMR